MGEATKIEWADATINPWWGCTKISPGCANCYADALAHRWGKDVWGTGKAREDHRAGARKLALRLNSQAEREGRQLRVFCASMADWLDPEVPVEWLADLLALITETPHLTWMLLTKRPGLWGERMHDVIRAQHGGADYGAPCDPCPTPLAGAWVGGTSPANVWVGTTVEDQERADQRIPALLEIPTRVRFLSCEPLLGPVDLSAWAHLMADRFGLDWWVICGGESGPGARPMHPSWARSLRDQCQEARVAFHFKQWGEWRPKLASIAGEPAPVGQGNGWGTLQASGAWFPTATPWNGRQDADSEDDGEVVMARAGKKAAGRLLDGRTWDEVPS